MVGWVDRGYEHYVLSYIIGYQGKGKGTVRGLALCPTAEQGGVG